LEQQKEDFIGIASHELKTPVTSIRAYTELMQELCEEGDFAATVPLVTKLNGQVDRLVELVHTLLDITKMEEGELPLHLEPFNLKEMAEERIEDLQRLSNIHRIIIQPEKGITVTADRERIGQVFTNLVSNAIKYSPKGGNVFIDWKQIKEGIEVSIKDEGIGISEEMRQKVFDRFFRANDVPFNTFPGMGLGLYISANIVRRHGGRIWVESKTGEGSIFYFTITG
ncbi:MAG TPA: HAMP domain-containing sensor histidine kinase, partial [Chitinophagaceae bacterium]